MDLWEQSVSYALTLHISQYLCSWFSQYSSVNFKPNKAAAAFAFTWHTGGAAPAYCHTCRSTLWIQIFRSSEQRLYDNVSGRDCFKTTLERWGRGSFAGRFLEFWKLKQHVDPYIGGVAGGVVGLMHNASSKHHTPAPPCRHSITQRRCSDPITPLSPPLKA